MSLPPDRFPNVVALAPPGPDERFDRGLDVLVRVLATYGPRPPG